MIREFGTVLLIADMERRLATLLTQAGADEDHAVDDKADALAELVAMGACELTDEDFGLNDNGTEFLDVSWSWNHDCPTAPCPVCSDRSAVMRMLFAVDACAGIEALEMSMVAGYDPDESGDDSDDPKE